MKLTPYRWTPALLAAALFLPACSGGNDDAPMPEADREPRQVIFVYDRSTSITVDELELYQRLTAQKLGELTHGDRVAAIELLQLSLAESPMRWSQGVPEREFQDRVMQRDSVSRVRFLQDARDYLRRFTEPDGRDNFLGTDVLSTFFDVAEEVRAYPGHQSTVILFSDMLQATDEMNMEGLIRMPSRAWIEDRAAQGRLPDFGGACFVVVGARTDTQAGQVVKNFWQDYFDATNGVLSDQNYSYRPVRVAENPCGGR